MRRQQASLLKNPERSHRYRITLMLQEGKTVEIIYNDRDLAEQQWHLFQGVGVYTTLVIKKYLFEEIE